MILLCLCVLISCFERGTSSAKQFPYIYYVCYLFFCLFVDSSDCPCVPFGKIIFRFQFFHSIFYFPFIHCLRLLLGVSISLSHFHSPKYRKRFLIRLHDKQAKENRLVKNAYSYRNGLSYLQVIVSLLNLFSCLFWSEWGACMCTVYAKEWNFRFDHSFRSICCFSDFANFIVVILFDVCHFSIRSSSQRSGTTQLNMIYKKKEKKKFAACKMPGRKCVFR